MNELKMEGFEYVPFPGDREDVVSLEVGGKTLSFVAPVDEMEELQKEKLRADIGRTNAAAASSWATANKTTGLGGGERFKTTDGFEISVPSFEEYLKDVGGRAYAMDSLTNEQIANIREEWESEVEVMEQAVRVSALSPVAQEIIANPSAYYDLTPSKRGEIFEELSEKGIATRDILSGKKRALPATQSENFAQAQLARTNVQTLYDMLQELPGTGPISGRMQALDPYDPLIAAVQAQITRTVPGLARGIFQEVGVLTDTDVTRYTSTLANPNFTDEQIERMHNDTMSLIDESMRISANTFSDLGYNMGDYDVEEVLGGGANDGLTEDEAYQLYLNQQSQ